MTFAIVAFLIGGFTINASAQAPVKTKAKTEKQSKTKADNYDKMLKDYESYINKYIAAYEKFLKGGNSNDKNDYMTYQKKALEIQGKLEKAKENLSKPQLELFEQLKARFDAALQVK